MKPLVPVSLDSAAEACDKVLARAGDALHRDAIDTRLIQQARSLGKSGGSSTIRPKWEASVKSKEGRRARSPLPIPTV